VVSRCGSRRRTATPDARAEYGQARASGSSSVAASRFAGLRPDQVSGFAKSSSASPDHISRTYRARDRNLSSSSTQPRADLPTRQTDGSGLGRRIRHVKFRSILSTSAQHQADSKPSTKPPGPLKIKDDPRVTYCSGTSCAG